MEVQQGTGDWTTGGGKLRSGCRDTREAPEGLRLAAKLMRSGEFDQALGMRGERDVKDRHASGLSSDGACIVIQR